jgi:hypothetical protein
MGCAGGETKFRCAGWEAPGFAIRMAKPGRDMQRSGLSGVAVRGTCQKRAFLVRVVRPASNRAM